MKPHIGDYYLEAGIAPDQEAVRLGMISVPPEMRQILEQTYQVLSRP